MPAETTHKPVIGILGGIGAGKTTVAEAFERLGCARIDADAIGHDVLDDPAVRKEVREQWGEGVFHEDGSVDRVALGDIVFHHRGEMDVLNGITHPRIREGIRRRIAEARQDPSVPAVVLDAAVAMEAGWDDLCTDLVFVQAPEEERASRAASARGWTRSMWQARENMQIALDTKLARCYHTVDNSSSITSLQEQVREIFHRIIAGSNQS